MPEFNLKESTWYKKWHSDPGKRKFNWKIWVSIFILFFGFIGFLFMRSPFAPNPILLFSNPSSSIETGTKPGEWATLARTPDHQRFINNEVSFAGKVRWSFTQSEEVDSSPAVVDGILYIGGYFEFLALAARSGKTLWATPLTGPVNSSPAVADDLIFMGLLDGRVIALDRHSGALKWQYKTGNFIIGSPTVVGGLLFIGSGDWNLYALDAREGTLFWKIQTQGNVIQAPAVWDNIVFAGSDDRKLYSVDTRTGALRLKFFLPGSIIDSPAVSSKSVFSVTSKGKLISFNPKARQYPWSYPLKVAWIQLWMLGFPVPTPSLQPGTQWAAPLPGEKSRFVSSPAFHGDRLYIGDDQGRFQALDALNGKSVWTVDLGDSISTAPLLTEKMVFFGTKTGMLYGLDRQNGSLRWKFSLGVPLKGDLVFGAGLLFVRTTNGKLYAIE